MRIDGPGSTSDADLWRQVVEGSRSAFEAVVARYQGLVAGVAFSVCGDLAMSEDVAQETFWASWHRRDSLQEPARLGPWLCGIARNQAANALRRQASRGSTSLGPPDDREGPGPDPAEEAVRREEDALIWSTLSAIPSLYREPLILYYRQEQSVADVAACLALSEDAVKQRLARGRALLRDRLADLVADGLRRSRPGRSFTVGVMAGLSAAGGSKAASAATVGLGTHAAAPSILSGGLLGMLAGLAGGWLGAWLPAQAAPSLTEKALILRGGRRLFVASLVFAAVIYFLARNLGGTPAYLPTWLAAMLGFLAWVVIDSWHLPRRIRAIRAMPPRPDDRNTTPLRSALDLASRRLQGRVYRSRIRVLGLPLVDVQAADPPAPDGKGWEEDPAPRRRTAVGWIAVGDEARGVLLAMGNRAFGGVAVGGLAVGIVAFGGVSIGLASLGGLAVGLLAIGGGALGGVAIGGLAVGDLAFGGAAVGWELALGGLAISWETAAGGAAIARHAVLGPEFAARILSGAEAGTPALDRPVVRAARWALGLGRPLWIGIGLMAVVLEMLRLRILYRRRIAAPAMLWAAAGLASLTGLAGCGTSAASNPTSRLQLDNGLTVLLRPVAGAAQVAVVVLYDVGGDHDPAEASGTAHLLEHLYVTAAAGDAPSRTAEDFFRRYPAGCNAQTGDRYTVFATVGPPEDFEAQVIDAAARMGSLQIADADLERELPRLREELAAMFERSPQLAAQNNAREIVRPTPNGGRRGGLAEQAGKITAADLDARWRRFYKPRNARLILAGTFDPAVASALVRLHFATIPQGDPLPPPGEPGPLNPEREPFRSLRAPGPTIAAAAIASPLPGTPGYADYLVLGARLMKEGQDGASGLQISMPLLDDPASLVASTVARPSETADESSRRLNDLITRVVAADLAPGEARAALSTFAFFLAPEDIPDQVLAANVYGVAFTLGRREQMGIDRKRLEADLDRVSPETLRRAAGGIFGESRRGLVRIGPAASPP